MKNKDFPHVGIIKLGQKIIFDRSNKLAHRNNSNGNYEQYIMIKLLVENNKFNNFYIYSDNDLNEFNHNFKNLWHINSVTSEDEDRIKTIILFAGLEEYESPSTVDYLYDVINNVDNLILISNDPRCLISTLSSKRLKRKPDIIFSQFDGPILINGVVYDVNYIPLETATSYQHKFDNNFNKSTVLNVIANSGVKKYNRIEKIVELLGDLKDIDIYGAITDDEVKLLSNQNYVGSVNYEKIPGILKSSKSTLIVPVDSDMITAKYVEALMYGCLPIFYKDYNTKLLLDDIRIPPDIKLLIDTLTVETAEELFELTKTIKMISDDEILESVKRLYEILIHPYVDGSILSKKIMRCVK